MPNITVDFKRFLKLLSPEEQLCEINYMISKFSKSNRPGDKIYKTFYILKEIRALKSK